MKQKKHSREKIASILSSAAAILSILAKFACAMARDGIVIHTGIRRYEMLQDTFTIAAVAGTLCAALFNFLYARTRRRRAMEELRAEEQARQAEAPFPDADELTEKGRDGLYQELANMAVTKWSGMSGITKLLAQLDSMNEYQSEMDRLLDQSRYLQQKPAEIVQQVEDCMYVNIRKLLNYMRIIQTKSPGVMSEKIAACLDKNGSLLKKTDDFIVAVVGYVNGDIDPGEDENARKSVDEYMYVVLRAIDLPEARLQ